MEKFDFSLTETAQKHYLKLLAQHPGNLGVVFFVKKAGCSGFMIQSELISDQNIDNILISELGDLKIFLSRKSMPYLKGVRVDVVKQGLGQSKVVYENPNEVARCGCGESFKIKDS